MRNSSSLDWLRFMHTPNDYRVSLYQLVLDRGGSAVGTFCVIGLECKIKSSGLILKMY